MAGIKIENIKKVYDNGFEAVKSINLDIKDKEFMVLVGPSGCGKTTTLRMIAGLEKISSGKMFIGDTLINDVNPKDRNISMVFQNYALYPHMDVYNNMAFGLKLKKTPKKEIEERINKAATILGIESLLKRKPKQLSGGQRQRVALGRAIVRNPQVFLMDEPLSNLDAKLRVQMRAELIKLHQDLQTTFVYVTHDQTEAMTMGTRICVMESGVIQQVDTPEVIYNNPSNLFVASFIGSPQMNFFNGTLIEEAGNYKFVMENPPHENATIKLELEDEKMERLKAHVNKELIMGIRPEHLEMSNEGIKTKVVVTELLGSDIHIHINVQGKICTIKTDVENRPKVGDEIYALPKQSKLHFFNPENQKAIV